MWIHLTNRAFEIFRCVTGFEIIIIFKNVIMTWKVSLQELFTAHPECIFFCQVLYFVMSHIKKKITFCISKFILKTSLIALLSKINSNILQSVEPTGSFSALSIPCEPCRCTNTRLSPVTSELLQLSMRSHQGTDTDINHDQRADCDRKVIKGQNPYTPLRKGEKGHKWLTQESRPCRPLTFPGTSNTGELMLPW